MFTSKKAQFLDKDFERISPITNIESLYYEQAENSSVNAGYVINRKSLVKNMPVSVVFDNPNLSTKVNTIVLNPGNYDPSVYINSFSKQELENDLFCINSSYWDLQKLLNLYSPINLFNSSIANINSSMAIINASMNQVNSSFREIQTAIKNEIQPMYSHYCCDHEFLYHEVITPNNEVSAEFSNTYLKNDSGLINNFTFLIRYFPYEDISSELYRKMAMGIKMQSIWQSHSGGDIPYLICLGKAIDITHTYEDVEKWEFQYDVYTNTITYLKDEFGNEGNFDFRNYLNSGIAFGCLNNQIYVNQDNLHNSRINIKGDIFSEKVSCNNKIYNSNNIQITAASNNTIINSNLYNLLIDEGASNNKIYNTQNSSIIINGCSSNIIINCENCEFIFKGNAHNNILMNLKNQNLKLESNNIIIGDEIGCRYDDRKVLSNDKLFLNYSSSTAIANDLTNYCTIFGGIGNDVSVYSDSYNTTNK